jgi:hypothetical protein
MSWYLCGLLSGVLACSAGSAFVFRFPRRLKWLASVLSRFAEALEPSERVDGSIESANKGRRGGKPVEVIPDVVAEVRDALINQGLPEKKALGLAQYGYTSAWPVDFEHVFREALKYRRAG